MKTISTHTFKYTLRDIHQKTQSRKFCFVIGAGASRKSGIPTGGELAKKWFEEIKERYDDTHLKEWSEQEGIDETDLAASYGSIYRKRFENDKTSGYEFLVQEMKTAKPSFGHIVLAQILSQVPGHCVLTTNFDNLVESSVYQFTNKTPLVCGHESLSGYARPSGTHPLIIKIHRDLLLAPKSDPDEINKLDDGWKEPLDNIFSTHIPVIIGYGGNDGSLMSYFENMSKPSNFFWCGINKSISKRIADLIDKHEGCFVTIDGFDELMHELLWVFDEIKPIERELNEITSERIQTATRQLNEILSPKNADQKLKMSKKPESLKEKKELSAFEYSNLAAKEPDLEKKKQIYIRALNKYPSTGWLWWEFANFLHIDKKEYSELDKYYQKAMELSKNQPSIIVNYAHFLKDIKKDYSKAEEHYLKALAIEPDNAEVNANYADFLTDIKKEYTKAEKYYLKALAIEPENADTNANYALFLQDVKKDYTQTETHFLKAITADPEDAHINGNYAVFLTEIKKDYPKAEEHYLKALATQPGHTNNNGNYASFLTTIKKDYPKAEEYYKKALADDSEDANINRNYALFLTDIKKDYPKAEEHYLKAIAIEPEDADINGNYALFLQEIKRDFSRAEEHFLKALAASPEDTSINGNYAIFLKDIKKDYPKAEAHFLKALATDPQNANLNSNYAIFLTDIKKDYPKAEENYLKALAVEPEGTDINGNYALFLQKIEKDYSKAEEHFLKALATGSEDADINGAYANFLKSIKKDYPKAEALFLKVLAAEPKHANNNGNYAQLLLEKGEMEKAEKYMQTAFNNIEEDDLLLELWFYRYAHFPAFLKEAEGKIEELLSKGVRSIGWNFDGNIEQAIKDGHPHPQKLKELANRITLE